jgi:hypothetical protein
MGEFYTQQMRSMAYPYGGVDTVLIRNPDRNQRLYRLAFYSKNRLAERFWNQARKYSTEQQDLL